MNHAENDDDMNLDDAMFLDRMGHLQIQIDEKIQDFIDKLAQELFSSNIEGMHLARIQVVDIPNEKALKHVIVDDNIHGHLITRIEMTSGFPQVIIAFNKISNPEKEPQSKQNRNDFFSFLREKPSSWFWRKISV